MSYVCFCIKRTSFNITLFFTKVDVEVLTYLMWGRVHITWRFLRRWYDQKYV